MLIEPSWAEVVPLVIVTPQYARLFPLRLENAGAAQLHAVVPLGSMAKAAPAVDASSAVRARIVFFIGVLLNVMIV
jgi:hypothetical protein